MTEQDESELQTFAQNWFDALSYRAPVDRLLEFVVDEGLVMVFPERTLRSHADVKDWYAAVGELFDDQSHTIEGIDATPTEQGTDLAVTVVWTARQLTDGERIAVRVNQAWKLTAPDAAGRTRIVDYRVGELTPIPA
jgi:hypothetical protein